MLDAKKAIQAAGVLLSSSDTGAMNYMRLIKILYLAERESLRDSGHAIMGDQVMAMKRGPVLSGVLDMINGIGPEAKAWSESISKSHYHVRLIKSPGTSELSDFEVEKLNEVSSRHIDDDEWEMVEVTHTLPEWQRAWTGSGAVPIQLRDILIAVGREADAERLAADSKTFDAERSFFTSK